MSVFVVIWMLLLWLLKRLAVPDFEPAVWFHAFGDSGIHFTVVLKVKDFADQAAVKHELIKTLYARYQEEEIQIFFPTRSLEISKETIQSLKS